MSLDLRREREARRLSLREVARRASICPASLSLFERGRLDHLAHDAIERVADAVGLDRDELLHASGRTPLDVERLVLDGGPVLWELLRMGAAMTVEE